MPHLNEAWWEEVHLLTLGRLGSSAKEAGQTASLINALLGVYPKPRLGLHRTDWLGRAARWILPTLQYERQIAWLLGRELVLAVQGCADARPEGRDPLVQKRLASELAEFRQRAFAAVRRLHRW